MGVEGLMRVIVDRAPDAVNTVQVHELKGQVALDMSIVVYQMASIGQSRGIVNADGRPINHMLGVFHRVVSLLAAGIVPIAVFDGPPPALKVGTIVARKARGVGPINRGMFDEVRSMLTYMGIAIVTAPGEAEAYAARGCAFATEDTDAIVFAALGGFTPRRVVFGLDSTGTARVVDVVRMLADMKLTPAQFVDMCALLGCDYNGGLRGAGPKRAFDLIRTHGSADAVLAHMYRDGVPVDIAASVNGAAVMQTYTAEATAALALAPPVAPLRDLNALADFMRAHGLGEKKITAGIARLAGL